MTSWNSWSLQNALSPVMEEFVFFNDFALVILILILTLSVGMFLLSSFGGMIKLSLVDSQEAELIWTLIPAIMLLNLSVPSLIMLYMLDDASSSYMTMKAIGHQWYWSYELGDFMNTEEMDSYMITEEDALNNGEFRLLDTDYSPVLPFGILIRSLVSSSDVLHSWAVPSLGVKVDATPGRLNQTKFISWRPGIAYGQCSEICGANHSFMPIKLQFTSMEDFFLDAVIQM